MAKMRRLGRYRDNRTRNNNPTFSRNLKFNRQSNWLKLTTEHELRLTWALAWSVGDRTVTFWSANSDALSTLRNCLISRPGKSSHEPFLPGLTARFYDLCTRGEPAYCVEY